MFPRNLLLTLLFSPLHILYAFLVCLGYFLSVYSPSDDTRNVPAAWPLPSASDWSTIYLPDGHHSFCVLQATLGMLCCPAPGDSMYGSPWLTISISVRKLEAVHSKNPNPKWLKQKKKCTGSHRRIVWTSGWLDPLVQWVIQGPGFSLSPLYFSPRIALSQASWVGVLSVAIRTTCFLVLVRRELLSQDCWRKMLSYGPNESVYDLYTNKVSMEMLCAHWSRPLPCTSCGTGDCYGNGLLGLGELGSTLDQTEFLRLHFCDRWQRGWMDVRQSVTMSTSILKSKLITSTHLFQSRPSSCVSHFS